MSREEAGVIVHGAAVALAGRGVLILGASGSGKSALALRMIGLGARLVADDRVALARRENRLVATAPAALAGMIEARGVGLIRIPPLPEVELQLVVDLDRKPSARMPQIATITRLGVTLELILGGKVPNLDLALTFIMQNGRAAPDRG